MQMSIQKLTLCSACAAVLLTGCQSMSDTQRTSGLGAGVGALAGAAVGSMVGGDRGAIATGAAIGALAGGAGGYLWSQRMENQKRQMEQATQGTGIQVSQTQNNELKLQIPSDASFDVGRAVIKPSLAPVLDQFASGLRDNPNADVRIIGHTDNTGSDAINNPLSVERAASARDYLIMRGVASSAIRIQGNGSREPIASNDTEAGRAQNRRVEIFVGERAPQPKG